LPYNDVKAKPDMTYYKLFSCFNSIFLLFVCCLTTPTLYGQNGCPQVPLSIIDGNNGFKIEGKAAKDNLGFITKSAGDINGDGIPDIMIGAPGADFGGISDVGEIYVIFGGSGFSFDSFDVSTLDGANGFVIRGVNANEKLGAMISPVGDFNQDGIDDIIVGHNQNVNENGRAFIFYGKNSGFLPLYNRTDIDSMGLFITLDSGTSITVQEVSSAGDVNHDGVPDVIITEIRGGSTANYYVVFGGASVSSLSTASLSGTNGFKIIGYSEWFSGMRSKAYAAGDVNNDGVDDLIIGCPSYNEGSNTYAGRVVIFFGKNTNFPASVELNSLNAGDGVVITNTGTYDSMGASVAAAGDFNSDGIEDFIVGVTGKAVAGQDGVGAAYVIFGRNTFPNTFNIDSINSTTGVIFQGTKPGGQFGFKVAGIFDVNNDGKDDIAISSRIGITGNESVYIVFGGSTSTGIVNESTIMNAVGYQIFDSYNGHPSSSIGNDVAGIGDFNQDGTNDFIIGSSLDSEFYQDTGTAYLFYGEKTDRTDTVKPTISCPVNQELFANSSLPNYVSFLPELSDNCTYATNFDLIITQDPPQGTLFTGDQNVTITVTDLSGNTSSCTFLVKLKNPPPAPDCKTTTYSPEDLNGANGFKIIGENGTINTGYSVSKAGDVNGDGISDFIISAMGDSFSWSGAFRNLNEYINSKIYVVFGTSTGFPPIVDLRYLDGTNGFKIIDDIDVTSRNDTGRKVSGAGDINGDGIDDFMISAPTRSGAYYNVGAVYVIFGKSGGAAAEMLLSSLNGSNGFTFLGTDYYQIAGYSIDHIGDFNNDGFDDIALAGTGNVPKVYVIYGKSGSFPALISGADINGINGCLITNASATDKVGRSVTGLGDVNGDGIPDIAVSSDEGVKMFVIYGRSGFPGTFNVDDLNGSNGFVVTHSSESLQYGYISKAGDLNNDGFKDIAIKGNFILFGSSSFPSSVDLNDLNGSNGFKITGGSLSDDFGGIGDFNNDGFDDYIFKTEWSNSAVYLLYGKDIWSDNFDIATLVPKDGLKINLGSFPYQSDSGFAGDINNDGFDDIIFGINKSYSPFESVKINEDPGKAYVMYGKAGIDDTEKPVIADCPTNKILAIGDEIPNYITTVTVTDNCDVAPVITQSPVAGTAYTGGAVSVTLKATDSSGNEEICVFTVSDNTDLTPVLTCPENQLLACGSLVPDYLDLVTVTDDTADEIELTQTPIAGTAFTPGMTITITATDIANNSSVCSFIVNASADTTDPVLTCIGDQTLSCGSTIPDYTALVEVSDNCDVAPVRTQNPIAGTAFTPGMTITITATDIYNNSSACSFKVNASADTTKPVLTCIGDQTLSCGSMIPDYTTLVTVTDNCDAAPVLTQNPIAGTAFTDGMTITITATDISNNSSACSFIVNSGADTIAPVLTCIGDQTLSCGSTIPDYTTLVTVTDNCDTAPVLIQNPIAGTSFTDGMTITITATDISNNSSACSFIVNSGADTTDPVLTCIGDQTLSCGSMIPDYTTLVTATDNCDAAPVLIQNPIAGTAFTDGMTITITATDIYNNISACGFIVNASADTTAPVLTCIGDQTLSCGSMIPDYTTLVTVTDNCDAAPVLIQNPIAGTAFTPGMTITITATDIANNSSICSFIVNASADTTKPVLTCIGDQTLSCGSTIPDYTTLVTVTDNCDAAPVLIQNPIAGTAFTPGMTITITATDIANNSSICNFIVNASADTTKPVLTCIGDQALSCGSTIPDYTALVEVSDNCDAAPVLTQNPIAGTAFTPGMTITITAKDMANNSSVCSFKVNASADTTSPVITCIGDQNLVKGNVLPDYRSIIVVTDNCISDLSIIQTPSPGTIVTDGMSVTMRVSDNSGNPASCTFQIHLVEDTEAPVFTCIADQLLNCSASTVPDYTKMIFATDTIDPDPIITQEPAAGSALADGMTVTINVTDNSNNSSGCTFQLFINPVLVDAGEDVQIIEGQTLQLDAVALEKGTFSWSPSTGLSNTTIENPIAKPSETTVYKVVFTNEQGCTTEDSVVITVVPLEKDETKYGISPNGDGINDFWEIDDITNYPNNEVLIYNRWGDLVFQTKNYNNSTNVFAGIANKSRNLGANQLPEGTYFFEIRTEQPNHFKKTKGYLVLKR
jgi:gliding motility-associated-like protein